MAETISKFNQMARTLAREHNRPLTFEELEKHLDISLNGVRDALQVGRTPVSLETPVGDREETYLKELVADRLVAERHHASQRVHPTRQHGWHRQRERQ